MNERSNMVPKTLGKLPGQRPTLQFYDVRCSLKYLPSLLQFGRTVLRCCFGISALRPWLLAFAFVALQIGFIILSKVDGRPTQPKPEARAVSSNNGSIRRLWLPVVLTLLLLGGCAAPYTYAPGGWPYVAEPYYAPPPGQLIYRPAPMPPPRTFNPASLGRAAPPIYREPPPDDPPVVASLPPVAPKPAPAPKPPVNRPAPGPGPSLDLDARRPVDPSCGWWRLCNAWRRSS